MTSNIDSQVTDHAIPFLQSYSATVFQYDELTNGFTNDSLKTPNTIVNIDVEGVSEDDDEAAFLSQDE